MVLVSWLRSWELQIELAEEIEMGPYLSQLSPVGSSAFTWDPEACPSEGLVLALSSFEEVDIVSINAGELKDLPRSRKCDRKLDECFLFSKSEPLRRGLCFFF